MECGVINMLDKNQINSVKKNNGTTNSFQNYIVIHNTDKQIVVPKDEANTDYQEILKWVAEGNTIEEAD